MSRASSQIIIERSEEVVKEDDSIKITKCSDGTVRTDRKYSENPDPVYRSKQGI